MCTLTWWSSSEPGSDRYEVFFNRDELKTRPVALPPEEDEKNGVRFLAPKDGAAGGTWLLVNELGVTIALLNWYSREVKDAPPESRISRGKLVLELGDTKGSGSLRERLTGFDAGSFQPFRLLVFFPGEDGLTVDYWHWSGTGDFKRDECPPMPICSSSFERGAVIRSRESQWRSTIASGDGPDQLWGYHHNGGSPETSAYTVRMNRPDAQTWSIGRVSVDSEQIRFDYEAETLNQTAAPESFEAWLDRVKR